VTRYRVLGKAPGMTWLEMKPETGRTHQIRVHCAHAGCPVIGDRTYGRQAPGQQMHLHSRSIVLPISKNKPAISVTAPPPAHMLAALKACGYDETQTVSGSPASKPASSAAPSSAPDS
jgi:hypothetical protein